MSSDRDTFLPHIESVFYATFHETRGSQILYQVPEGLISQVSTTGNSSTNHTSRNHNSFQPPARGHFESSSTNSLSPVCAPIVPTPSSSITNLSTTQDIIKPTESPTRVHRTSNSSSVSTLDMSSPSSPTSYRSLQHRHLQPCVTSNSPQKSVSTHSFSGPTPLLDFSDISHLVIPMQDMCGRLVICATQRHRVIGFPVCLEAAKYKRVHFRYNLCFVFERTADLSCYEPVVRKIARVLMACEVRFKRSFRVPERLITLHYRKSPLSFQTRIQPRRYIPFLSNCMRISTHIMRHLSSSINSTLSS